jgi:hypothetical protein
LVDYLIKTALWRTSRGTDPVASDRSKQACGRFIERAASPRIQQVDECDLLVAECPR